MPGTIWRPWKRKPWPWQRWGAPGAGVRPAPALPGPGDENPPSGAVSSPEIPGGDCPGAGTFYEHTRVLELSGNTAVTDRGDHPGGRKSSVATHFPFLKPLRRLFPENCTSSAPMCWPWRRQPRWRGCILRQSRGDCPSGIMVTCCFWEAGDTAPARPGAAGSICCGKKSSSTTPQPGSVTTGAAQDCMTLDGMAYVEALFPGHPEPVCGHRLSQVGHDRLHWRRQPFLRDIGAGKGKPLRPGVCPGQAHAPAPSWG